MALLDGWLTNEIHSLYKTRGLMTEAVARSYNDNRPEQFEQILLLAKVAASQAELISQIQQSLLDHQIQKQKENATGLAVGA